MNLKDKIKPSEDKASIPQLVSELMQSAVYIHKEHLRTKSFAAHKALNEYYEAIPDHADSIAEQYQGQYGIQNYPDAKLPCNESISYLKTLAVLVEKTRLACPDSHIQNQLDEVKSLIYSTLYKLENLA